MTGDTGTAQTLAQGRRVRGRGHLDAEDRLAGQCRLAGGGEGSGAFRPRAVRVPGLDVEVGHLPAVAHQERPAVLEASVQMDHRPAGLEAIRRLEDEAAKGVGHGYLRSVWRNARHRT